MVNTTLSTNSTANYEWCTSTNQCDSGELCYFGSNIVLGVCVPCTVLKKQDNMSIYIDTSKWCSSYNEHQYNELQPGSFCNNSLQCSVGSSCIGLLKNGILASCNGNIRNIGFETPCYCQREKILL